MRREPASEEVLESWEGEGMCIEGEKEPWGRGDGWGRGPLGERGIGDVKRECDWAGGKGGDGVCARIDSGGRQDPGFDPPRPQQQRLATTVAPELLASSPQGAH